MIRFTFCHLCKNNYKQESSTEITSQSINLEKDALRRFKLRKISKIQAFLYSIIKVNGGNVTITVQGSEEHQHICDSSLHSINPNSLEATLPKLLGSIIEGSTKLFSLIHFWHTSLARRRQEFYESIRSIRKLNNTRILLTSIDYYFKVLRKRLLHYNTSQHIPLLTFITKTIDAPDGTNFKGMPNCIKIYDSFIYPGIQFN